MNSLKRTIFPIIILSFLFASCERNFQEINIDPNRVQEISPGSLLNEIVYNMAVNNDLNYIGITARLMQVQVPSNEAYGGVQRYEILGSTGNSIWNAGYKWANNVSEMLKVARKDSAVNYIAVALTLKAWIYSNLSDCFGDIPFSQASKAEDGVFQAAYDGQDAVYGQLLADLEEANSLYSDSIGMLYGEDLLFHNDVTLWRKFTNSLRLRLLLKASNVDPNAIQEMVRIINNPNENPIIDDFESQAVWQVSGEGANISPWPRTLDLTSSRKAASFFVDALNDLNDPRRPIILTKATLNGEDIGYKGIPAGYDESNFQYSASNLNNEQDIAPMFIPILTYAEVAFIKAELAQKGYLSNAEGYYKTGVNAAIKLWTGQDVPADYFTNPNASYDGTLERIMTQKYLSLYMNDYQQWDEYRRTGLPKLPVTSSMLNGAVMPSRLMYPSGQVITNPKNYNEQLDKMGGSDDINFKAWWDRN